MASTAPTFSATDIVRGASALTVDSRSVSDGAIFVAMRGLHVDGHRFIDDAVTRGARTIVMEQPRDLPPSVRAIVVADSARALAEIADAFYGSPAAALTLIGVTGTNGKTTTTHMIAAILNAAGTQTGIIGTLGAALLDYKTPLKNTTPLADELHKTLADLRDRGARAVVLEVSSHALALNRVAGLRFAVAALTNVTRDHLDFHGTFESYASAKRTLFEACERAIFNVDDDCGAAWSRTFEPERAVTYSLHGGADFVAEDITPHAHGSRFFVDGTPFEIPLAGRFNVANALAAIAVGRALNIDFATIAMALRSVSGVRGRMEMLEGQSLQVFIDYAHTPDALSAALRSLRELKPRRLTVVFGCGGDRDRGKRSEMGAIATQLADRIIVTSDNPRSEPPAAIAQAIVDGIGHGDHEVILDRRAAIERAIEGASSGEMVLIAGKGHETSQTVGDRVLAFDDRQVAADALRRRSERR